jgi:hypothetical protein
MKVGDHGLIEGSVEASARLLHTGPVANCYLGADSG